LFRRRAPGFITGSIISRIALESGVWPAVALQFEPQLELLFGEPAVLFGLSEALFVPVETLDEVASSLLLVRSFHAAAPSFRAFDNP